MGYLCNGESAQTCHGHLLKDLLSKVRNERKEDEVLKGRIDSVGSYFVLLHFVPDFIYQLE